MMTEDHNPRWCVRVSLRDLFVATAVIAAMFAAPFAAVGLLLFGSAAFALFTTRPPSAARWTFVAVAWLTALLLVPLLPSWPGPGWPTAGPETWRQAALRFYPVVIAAVAGLAASWSLRCTARGRSSLPLAVSVPALAAWFMFGFESFGLRTFLVLLEIALDTLFWVENGPPPDVDAHRLRPRVWLYLILAAALVLAAYGLVRLIASYRADRRRTRESAARLRAELDLLHAGGEKQ